MPSPSRIEKRNPPRPSVLESVEALLDKGATIYDIRIDRRNDVVFAVPPEKEDVTLHEQGEWEKPHGSGL